ncbi:cation transporting ATPase C-terminal domain-containing protein [Zoogloeaceae bacterium G21618-S1]|nr:cation transporting ATPase C-terminal domain-containing protein [Zoogloeaceae bacterium G21618-S1]
MMAATFAVFEWVLARGAGIDAARTAAVNMLVVGELVYLFNVRHFAATAFHRRLFTGNPVALWMAVLLVGLQLAFTYAPPLQRVFHTVALDATTWGMIVALGAAKFVAVELEKAVLRRLNIRSM